jgi:hypothetical protein
LKIEKEFVVGDTSNLNQPPVIEKKRPMVHLEAGTSLLFPISRLIDYDNSVQPGMHLGLEWESGWGFYLGAIRSQVKGEVDDDEILTLNPRVIASLPNAPADINTIDEIYLTNRQWYFPVELRWRSLYYNGFSFESSLGIIGNYLYRQDFTYELEDNQALEYQYGASTKSHFGLSHIRMGVGTNYLLTKKWGFFLRSHYWLPVSRQGIFEDRTHGLEVGLGVNFLIGK